MGDLKSYEHDLYKYKEGTAVLSPGNSDVSAAVVVRQNDVAIISGDAASGIIVSKQGITLQGSILFTRSGLGIAKGNYTENPDSAKLFTYPETIYFESAVKEAIYKTAGEVTGRDMSDIIKDGAFPIITDIAPGPVPHAHTISMKHVHRIEPAYLYRIPTIIKTVKSFASSFNDFLRT